MKPLLVMIAGSEHPWFEEGDLIDFEAFETLAIYAAQNFETASDVSTLSLKHPDDVTHEGCVDVVVYFSKNHAMELHLHPYQGGGDFGVYDVLGDLMANDPTHILKDLERVLH